MSGMNQPTNSLSSSPSNNETLRVSAVVFMAIALYNSLELSLLIPLSFRHYHSLYFWSILTSATLGVIPATLGPGFQLFNISPLWLSMALSNLGFALMVPNQSVVLYSRLHLVSRNTIILRAVRWTIITSFFLVAIPTILTNIVSTYKPSTPWTEAFQIIERFQVTWFAVQECAISGVYIYDTIRLIRLSPTEDKRRNKILYELLAINIAAIVMDSSLLILEYLGYYFAQVVFKATVYSIKLKFEFAVLGMLVELVHSRASESHSPQTWRAENSPVK